MRIVTRRGLFVVGGTGVAGAALTACGTQIEQRDAGHDQELLDAEASAEAALGAAYANLGHGPPAGGPETADVVDELGKASRARQGELSRLGASATGGPDTGSGSEAGEHAALDAANTAIAAYRTGAGQLSSEERRSVAAAFLAQVAAEVATLSGLAGADQAPEPFVTGLGTKPFESIESNQTSTTSTAAEPGSTSSTTTGAGG